MLVFKTSQFAQNSIQVAIQRYDEAKVAHPLQISLKVEHAIETALEPDRCVPISPRPNRSPSDSKSVNGEKSVSAL